MSDVNRELRNEIVRQSEISQEQRRDIEKLRDKVNFLMYEHDKKETAPKAHNFDQLRYLVEELINICDQTFLEGGMTMSAHDRVSEVRKKYESIMKGVREND